MSSRKWSDDEHLKVVQFYRKEVCLWNIRSPSYRNKEMRLVALQNICNEMNIEGLDTEDVKNKIKTLRSTYYLECDKIKKSSRPGVGGNVYVPKMKWFSELHDFIKDVAVKRKKSVSKQEDNNINIYFTNSCFYRSQYL